MRQKEVEKERNKINTMLPERERRELRSGILSHLPADYAEMNKNKNKEGLTQEKIKYIRNTFFETIIGLLYPYN